MNQMWGLKESELHQGGDQFHLWLFDERLDLRKTLHNLMMQENNSGHSVLSNLPGLVQVLLEMHARGKRQFTIPNYQNVNHYVLT